MVIVYQYLSLNVTEFRIEHPLRLWLLIILLPINILWVKSRIWKNKAIKRFAKQDTLHKIFNGFSNNRSTVKYFLFRLSIGLLIIAAANPQYGENERTIESKGIDIMDLMLQN